MNTSPLIMTFWSMLLAVALTASHALLRAAAKFPQMSLAWLYSVAPAMLIYVLVFLGYTYLLRYFPVSQLFPIYTALSVAGVFFAGIVLFGEPVTGIRLFGLLLVLAGIILLTQ